MLPGEIAANAASHGELATAASSGENGYACFPLLGLLSAAEPGSPSTIAFLIVITVKVCPALPLSLTRESS